MNFENTYGQKRVARTEVRGIQHFRDSADDTAGRAAIAHSVIPIDVDPLPDTAALNRSLDLRGDVHMFAVLLCLEIQVFGMRFH